MKEAGLENYAVAVVIPCYKVGEQIDAVLRSIPPWVRIVIAVNDASPDDTGKILENAALHDPRVIVLHHERNLGVGGAMVTGFCKALELKAQVVVKIDGDGQMSVEDLPTLVWPLVRGEADYAKGNRFRDFAALREMPPVRRFGNMALSFLVKGATGYWNCFDPNNGYVVIRGDVLALLPLNSIDRSFFFEISMLAELHLVDAVVRDIPIPARYGREVSNLSIGAVLRQFPLRLLKCFCRRIVLKNFVYDFNVESLEILTGLPLLLFGSTFGLIKWIEYSNLGLGAPTGTVVIPAMLILVGIQLLLSALERDVLCVPREPVGSGPLERL